MAKIIKVSVVALAFLAAVIAAVFFMLPKDEMTVSVEPGATAREIARSLTAKDIILSEPLFLAWARLTGSSTRFKAGVYRFSRRSTVFSVTRRLSTGSSRLFRATVPEGYTAAQIADLLSQMGLVDRAAFLRLVGERGSEGYLFPQTYYLEPYLGEGRIIDIMTAQFRAAVTPEMLESARRMKMTERDLVIMASIVEKEAVRPEERPLIAGVFYNRLRKGWLLESCATVQYARGERAERLSVKDTRIDSPYNTYRHYGLPPGPICNPGGAALRAAAFPAKTDDMFFVAASSGAHIFSQYYAQHMRNKRAVAHAR